MAGLLKLNPPSQFNMISVQVPTGVLKEIIHLILQFIIALQGTLGSISHSIRNRQNLETNQMSICVT